MSNNEWLVFSFSLPPGGQSGRVKVWRRLNALGAAQIKNAIYVLPGSASRHEQLAWLCREVEELGGEALFLACPRFENIDDEAARSLFAKAREADYLALEREIEAAAATLEKASGPATGRERRALARRFERRLEAVRALDFFPGRVGDRVAARLAELANPRQGDRDGAPAASHDPADYRGLTWLTRRRPYVDRLASIWLVRRFIDPLARLRFVDPAARPPAEKGVVRFDMAEAEFTHQEGLITFEVMARAFGLGARIPAGLMAAVRAVDIGDPGEEGAPDEAAGLKRLLDGLLALCPDDETLVERALVVFDALAAAYPVGIYGKNIFFDRKAPAK